MRHEKPNATQSTWYLPAGSTFRPCATRCARLRSRSRPGLRRTASSLPVRLLRLLPLRVRPLRLLWARVVLRRDLYWRRTLVPRLVWPPRLLRRPRLLWPSRVLWSLGFLWPLRLQGRRHGSRTGQLRTRPSRWRIPRWLRTRRLCTRWFSRRGWFPRRRTQVDRIPDSTFNGQQCALPAVSLFIHQRGCRPEPLMCYDPECRGWCTGNSMTSGRRMRTPASRASNEDQRNALQTARKVGGDVCAKKPS